MRIAKESRNSVNAIEEQLRVDRQDINKNTIDIAKITKQLSVIIDNQDHQEEGMVEAVTEATQTIKPIIKKSLETMFQEKPFLKRLVDKFKRG